VPASVTLREVGGSGKIFKKIFEGISKAGTADINDMLAFPIYRACPPRRYEVTAAYAGQTATRVVAAGANAQEVVVLALDQAANRLEGLLADRFGTDAARQAAAQRKLAALPADATSCALAWQVYRVSSAHDALRQEFEQKKVSTPDRTSPYLWRYVGQEPFGGWGLVIAMHGGGNAPKEVNDQQWNGMYRAYYHEHPEAGGYIYLALRAPNDTWNGFYDDAICPLVENLIKQFVLFADVNPDRVYTLGASHGGYGAFVIGPKIPYRFAAVHASASAPTGGETQGENLRNVRFTFMVGEQDTAYGRAGLCQKFAQQVEAWRKQYNGGFSGEFELEKNTGHFVPDHDKVAEMLKFQRFYWLEALTPANGGHIEAQVAGNTITLHAAKQDRVALWLDRSLVDLGTPITVIAEGKRQVFRAKPNLETYCLGLERTADPHLTAPVRIEVTLN
jgi:poly(3-hydroxybutyrate) depolymerase